MWLVLCEILALHLERVARILWVMIQTSYASGVSALLTLVAQSFFLPIVLVLSGAVGASLLTRGRAGRERMVDLVALCAVAPVCLELCFNLVLARLARHP